MGAITGTKAYAGEFAGEVKILVVTATVASASDTITLTAAAHGGVASIVEVVGYSVKTGIGANFSGGLQISFSGLVITVVSTNAAGAASTSWGNISIAMLIKTTA